MKTALVLLPGSLGDADVWSPQVEALGGDYDVIVPDVTACGTLAERGRAALGLVQQPRLAVAGHALGARVALEMVRLAPERVERLALISASITPVAPDEGARRREGVDLAAQQGMAALAQRFFPRVIHPSRIGDTALLERLGAMAQRFTPDDYRREAMMMLARPDQAPILATIACPTLVLAGADDPLSTAERNRQIAGEIAGAELVFVEGAAHFPMLESPDDTTRALRRWLLAA